MKTNKLTKIKAIFSPNPMASSHPLISTIVTLYTLIFLYFPTTILLSPLLLSTSLLLLSLLRLGASQRKQPEPENPVTKLDPDSYTPPLQIPNDSSDSQTERGSVLDPEHKPDLEPTPFHLDSFVKEWNVRAPMEVICTKDPVRKPDPEPYFVEWNVRAPLEVIYEAYDEGEGEEEEDERIIERYASLSMYYPETDTDSYSSEEGNMCFRWDEEDREGLIEIQLDSNNNSEVIEEDNLIEIDLNFPAT